MNNYETLDINEKLLLLSLILESWYEKGFKKNDEVLYPNDFEFDNPLETSRIFYLESFYIQNKEVPNISYSIESSININNKLKNIIKNFNELNINEKLIFINKEFNNFFKKCDYKKLDIFKSKKIKNDFVNVSNNILEYLNKINSNK